MNKIKQILIAITLGLIFANPVMVIAQTTSNAIEVPKYGGVQDSIAQFLCTPSEGAADGKDLERCINKMYRFGISFGGIALVFFLVFAGYMYIMGGESGKTKAKGIVQNALVGIAILLGSYVILYFINPNLTILKSIQPPIFDAANLPRCDEVGFGEQCVVPSGGVSSGGGGKCVVPIAESSLNGAFNNTIHGRSGHGPVRDAPNSPPPEGIVDVGGKGGSPVFSAITGKVVHEGDLGRTGKYVSIISDPAGDRYGCEKSDACANQAHIDPSVKVGDMVTAGQQIGVLTNYSTNGGMGPHLHMELKLGGQWVLGDGFKATWTAMKTACANSGAGNGGGGEAPAGTVAVNDVVVDMQYVKASPSSHNFMSTALYVGEFSKYGSVCYLASDTAAKIAKAAKALESKKWKIKAWDCYRPIEIQKKMYDWAAKNGKSGLVAVPGNGKHPKGMAIDATLVDENGKDVLMPTHFDYFVKNGMQHPGSAAYNATPKEARDNAALLNKIMTDAGLKRAGNEWWHFEEK